jgi:hypothetical protein
VGAEKIQQSFRLRAAGSEMDVGDKQSAKAPLWALFTHIVTSHTEQLSDFRDSVMTIDEACGTTCSKRAA